MKTTRSPVVAASDFHSASPLPRRSPWEGSTSAAATTSAPAARATSAVRSLELESTTTTSSTSGTSAHPAVDEISDEDADGRLLVAGRAGRR